MIVELVFYVLAAILIGSAAMVVSTRNPVHAVLYLILAFFNAAGLFLIAGAEFLAMILVIVYVGAVAVLFLFVVMMLDIDFDQMRQGFQGYAPIGVALGTVLLLELVLVLGIRPQVMLHPRPVQTHQVVASNTHALGVLLYTDDVLLFQSVGVILLIAMIGAIVLTLRDRRTAYRQDVSLQHARDPTTAVRMVDLSIGGGINENGGVRRNHGPSVQVERGPGRSRENNSEPRKPVQIERG